MTPQPDPLLAECAEVCTSGCHSDDCEHHGHLPEVALPVQDEPGLREALKAAEILLNAKSGPYNYASWPQREENEQAEAVWDRWLAIRATPAPLGAADGEGRE